MPSAYARTIRQIINDTLRLCGDYQGDGQDGMQWLWTEMLRELKDTALEFVRRTGMLKEYRIITLSNGTAIYDLPGDCVRILRVGIHGLSGTIVLPRSMAEYDYMQSAPSDRGYPREFFKDNLQPHQIGFWPTPNSSGSTFTRDSDYGLLRRVVDENGNELTYAGNDALRRISGVPFVRSGRGNIIREVISPYGNILLLFVRAPEFPELPDQYIDDDIPDFYHKDFKYGVACRLMRGSRKKIHAMKLKKFQPVWDRTIKQAQRYSEHKGPMDGLTIPHRYAGTVNNELFNYPTDP